MNSKNTLIPHGNNQMQPHKEQKYFIYSFGNSLEMYDFQRYCFFAGVIKEI